MNFSQESFRIFYNKILKRNVTFTIVISSYIKYIKLKSILVIKKSTVTIFPLKYNCQNQFQFKKTEPTINPYSDPAL